MIYFFSLDGVLWAIDKKTGLRNYDISIHIRIHGQNHDAHLSFKALHQIICSLHESVPKVPGRTLKVYIFYYN